MTTSAPVGRPRPSPFHAPPALARHRALLAVCIGGAVLESLLLLVTGQHAAQALAPQVTALGPIGVFHDIRWLMVFQSSWLAFGAELAALVAIRTALSAVCIRLAWPEQVPPPRFTRLLRQALAGTLVAGAMLYPLAALLFGMAIVSVSYFFLGAFPLAVAVMCFMPHAALTSWWRRAPSLRGFAWAAASLVVLTVAGGLAVAVPAPAAVPLAALAGWFNAWAWQALVRALVVRPAPRFRPVAPVALLSALGLTLGTIALVVGPAPAAPAPVRSPATAHEAPAALSGAGWSSAGLSAAGFTPAIRPVSDRSPVAAAPRPVLVVSGYGAPWTGRQQLALGPGFDVRRFSYRGLDARGQPLPYSGADTHQPLPALVRELSRQVSAFARQSGGPIAIAAASEGALATTAYLADDPRAPVDRVVLLSPLIDPARVYFPPDGTTGWGVAAGASVRAVVGALDAATPLQLSADDPLVRSIDDHAAAVGQLSSCPLPGIAEMAIYPLADAVGAPYGPGGGVPVAVVPAFHGVLIDSPEAAQIAAAFLSGGRAPYEPIRSVADRTLRAIASTWQVPSLPAGLNPAWGDRTPAGCAGLHDAVRAWLGPVH